MRRSGTGMNTSLNFLSLNQGDLVSHPRTPGVPRRRAGRRLGAGVGPRGAGQGPAEDRGRRPARGGVTPAPTAPAKIFLRRVIHRGRVCGCKDARVPLDGCCKWALQRVASSAG
jgi:hypothetical protein